jgi:FtsP/CotA-like multicopper oxidase with cupredoxin domain
MAGVVKDTVQMPRQQSVEADFVANDPGLTLLHHMDEGFMMLMEYV